MTTHEEKIKDLITRLSLLEYIEHDINHEETRINKELQIQSKKYSMLNFKSNAINIHKKQVNDMFAKLKIEESIVDNYENFLDNRKKTESSIKEIDEIKKMLNEYKQIIKTSNQRIQTKKKILTDLNDKIITAKLTLTIKENIIDSKKEKNNHLKNTIILVKTKLT